MPKNAEYKQIQEKILQHLFEKANRVSLAAIEKLIGKPESETKYHVEELVNSHLAVRHDILGSHDRSSTEAYEITPQGRKHVMEKV